VVAVCQCRHIGFLVSWLTLCKTFQNVPGIPGCKWKDFGKVTFDFKIGETFDDMGRICDSGRIDHLDA
jgi:hypothetical protein